MHLKFQPDDLEVILRSKKQNHIKLSEAALPSTANPASVVG